MTKLKCSPVWIGFIACGLLLAFSQVTRAAGQPTIQLSPSPATVSVGQEVSVEVLIRNAPLIYGAEVHITFDPAMLAVVDADPAQAGIQITPGSFLDPAHGFTLLHQVDNQAGIIDYALTLLNPALAVEGDGLLARITFQTKMTGQTTVTIVSGLFGTRSGDTIIPDLGNAQIRIEIASPPSKTPTPTPTDTPTATPVTCTITGSTGMGGVTLSYNNGTAKTVISGSTGSYTITVPCGWSGTITPSKTGYTFSPASRSYSANPVTTNLSGQNFTPLVTISGNAGESGVTLRYTDVTAKSVTSGSNGRYTITVPYNWSGSVTPSKTGLTFSPASKSYSHITANQASQNYYAVMTILSTGSYDGWVLESSESSGAGGSLDATATTLILGDNSQNRQYRALLSFNTASLPDTAVLQSAVVKIKQSGSPVGTSPFSVLGNLYVDIRKGYFGTSAALQTTDFNAAASTSSVAATFGKTPVSTWYSATLTSTGRTYVNKTSLTQLRLRFSTDDNNNLSANYMRFYSGNYSSSSYRPQLIVTYTLP